jgi:hypothetical protein
MGVVEASDQLLIFERSEGRAKLRCSFNLSPRPASFTAVGRALITTGDVDERKLGPYAAAVEEIA